MRQLPEVRGEGYYYPDPAAVPEWFHSLPRQVAEAPTEVGTKPCAHR